ncbi:hypothetical protein ACF1FC_11510 [Streptomyces sp. NPDC014344]|uniref:hypothetical protein n=1 Tax=Streptomyces sp. NPDC014344 TaxID=3364871 RepID=UPI003700AA2C
MRLRTRDGAEAGPPDAPAPVVRDRRAPRRRVAGLESERARAAALAGPGRARVRQLRTAAPALASGRDRTGVARVVAVRASGSGSSGLPLRSRTRNRPGTRGRVPLHPERDPSSCRDVPVTRP